MIGNFNLRWNASLIYRTESQTQKVTKELKQTDLLRRYSPGIVSGSSPGGSGVCGGKYL